MNTSRSLFGAVVAIALIVAVAARPVTAQDDRRRIEELERKVAELERRLRALEGGQRNVPVARVGRVSVTLLQIDLTRDVESVRAGTAQADWFLLVLLMERAFYDEMGQKLGVQVGAEELNAERLRLDRETPAEQQKKIKAVFDGHAGMYDSMIVRPGLVRAKVEKLAAGGGAKEAQDFLTKALADPFAISKEGAVRPKDYVRIDSRNIDDDEKKAKAKEWDEKNLGTLRSGQVKPELIDTGDGWLVAKLIERRGKHTVYEYITFKKGAPDAWFREQLRAVEVEVTDATLKEEMRTKGKGYPLVDRLFNR